MAGAAIRPAAVAVEAFRNSRRDVEEGSFEFISM
jgi:hypothetical protein